MIQKFFNHFGYEVTKNKTGFSLHNNLNWIKELHINTIFDIGANDGGFAKFINNILPHSTIYSFEPIIECYEKLSNIKNINKLIPFNYALGDSKGELDFFLNDFSYSSSFLKISNNSVANFPYTKNQSVRKVKVKKLDDIYCNLDIKKNVLVKIDVQGFEDKVINGGALFFKETPLIVIIESSIQRLYENEPLFLEIFELMKKKGYIYKGNLDQLYSPVNGSILQVDAIFMKE